MAPLRGPRSSGDADADVVVSEAAIRGCGLPGTCSIRSRASGSSCSRAASAATARAGGTAGSASRSGSARPRSASASATSAARSLLDASSETVGAIGAWCEDNDVDAWFDQSGYLCVSTGEAFDDVGLDAVEAARALGKPDAVQRPDRRSRCASGWTRRCSGAACSCPTSRPCSRRGWRSACAAGCSSGAWRSSRTRGCARCARSRAGRVRSRRETAGGRVRAGAAVLAVGPSARSFRPLRSRLSVTSSHIVLTEPVPDVIERIGWTGGECITDGRTLLHYFRTTRDGRIVVRLGRRAARLRQPR